MSSWSSPRMLAQKAPTALMRAHVDELRSGKNPTSGGSSEMEVKVPTAMPTGPSWVMAVMTTTPVG